MTDSVGPPAKTPRPKRSRKRTFIFAMFSLLIALIIGGILCEVIFRFLEGREVAQMTHEGEGGRWIPDGHYGWIPTVGTFRQGTSEFKITGSINALHMNDDAVVPGEDDHRTRILALGDSHTYAVGVDTNQTWPKVLQAKLNGADPAKPFRVYNTAVMGYNMHQYLLRLIDLGPVLKPHYVVLGLSYATDLYDLLTPEHGGWIYGSDSEPRDYFDFDDAGQLVEKHYDPKTRASTKQISSSGHGIRQFLNNFATIRYLRRSRLGMAIGSKLHFGGQSLWPNVEVIVEKQVPEIHQYQWKLFEALLDRIKIESDKLHAPLIVVGIPYLPQVYDDVWQTTFGGNPAFSRTAGIERVKAMCEARGIIYVETVDALRERTKATGHWVHFHKDAHPTVEGQEVIAEAVYRAGVFKPISKPATGPTTDHATQN